MTGLPYSDPADLTEMYLELLKQALTASLYPQSAWRIEGMHEGRVLITPHPYREAYRVKGHDWPMFGYSMVGHYRLDNVRACVESAIRDEVPGDLVEAGVWQGGTTIFMRGILKAYGITDRTVWAADSFEGMPAPADANDGADLSHLAYLSVSLEDVQANFARFGLLDAQVRFVKGWFADALPQAPIKEIAVLRLDGDMYSSTMDALNALYDKVSPGGYVIADDYHSWPSCRRAVDEFLAARGLSPHIRQVDWAGAYWRVGYA
ncbi:MAG: TylF/MycF/NovP-related O-methyltransferase [Saprospiraceae bacterium]|nr:TylF/MycF/NovP-related O-methyltransferase [Saprospiraceae bacterium]